VLNNKGKIMIPSETITAKCVCRICNNPKEIPDVPVAGLKAWEDGELIQDALPNLTADQRELLISGTCDDCWKTMFGTVDDEELEDDEV
jgi:hypothetical protein